MEWKFVLTRCGDDLCSIAVGAAADAQALAVQLRNSGDWLEVVPGVDSVVVRFDATVVDAAVAEAAISAALAGGIRPLEVKDELIEIPVVYGGDYGPDLDELSESTGLSVTEIIELHTSRDYPVDMIGFTPGFAFIGNLDERLRVPRRKEPRQRVPAGSVGIADGRTGLYAMASPGGWTLIGRTPRRLFDAQAETPFVLQPGMRVRFRAIAAEEFNA
jgi:KipI family sensor histidine kinase inhibitor